MFSQIKEGKFTENIASINIQGRMFTGMREECTILIYLIFKLKRISSQIIRVEAIP